MQKECGRSVVKRPRCRQRQPHVFLILFSVWKPIKKENSRVSSTEIKTSEISLFPFSFRDSTMSSSSSSLSEKKKPPPVVDSDAAVPTASVPASAPSEPKPTESVPASAPSEPTKKKRVRRARQAQAVPGYGDVKVTELKPDRTEVFKLGWQARRVLHAAAAEPQSAEPSTPHAPIELRRDGSLDDSVIASLQRVAAGERHERRGTAGGHAGRHDDGRLELRRWRRRQPQLERRAHAKSRDWPTCTRATISRPQGQARLAHVMRLTLAPTPTRASS
jgi:hypothetical protein